MNGFANGSSSCFGGGCGGTGSIDCCSLVTLLLLLQCCGSSCGQIDCCTLLLILLLCGGCGK